ncbi:hypothetical protein NP493_960g02018 [Ridgeia piscesae]|uniref:Uncharacterized protein n=1 Tax=Ridgeia piscesae TaxID=27915 RepID=A0AAD9KJT9_RIDPI|nr:hypothetical protein NP493_960g02018 [Ridgeia piscesae]
MVAQLVSALTDLEKTEVAQIVQAESDRVRASQRAAIEDRIRKLASPPSESDRVRASQRAKEEEQVRQLACPPRGSEDTEEDKSKRCVEVFKFLKQLKQPQLWRSVAGLFVGEDGELDLAYAVSPDDLPALKYILESGAARGITYLSLDHNNLTGAASSAALAECLRQATWLKKLSLHQCDLRKDDVDVILPAIATIAGLKVLWLSENYLDDVTARSVVSVVLRSLPQMVHLSLSRNEVTKRGVTTLRTMTTPRPGLYLPTLDLQYPAGDDRSGTVAWWERYLARVRGVVSDLRTRPGDWALDLARLKTREQEAVDKIQRLS